jgi:hypothetical protein
MHPPDGGGGAPKPLAPDRATSAFRPRALLFVVSFMLLAGLSGSMAVAQVGPSGAVRIHVRGGGQIHALAALEGDQVTIRGDLVDDAGDAIARATVAIQATAGDGTKPSLSIVRGCDESSRAPQRTGPGQIGVDTDERGSFCARLGPFAGEGTSLNVRYAGSPLHDPTEVTVKVEAEPELLHTLLRFEPQPEVIDLDRESTTVTAALRVDRTDGRSLVPAGQARREGLSLALLDERGQRVAEATTGGDGRARFVVPSAALADPGEGMLAVTFGGSPLLAKATAAQSVVRRAAVRLDVPEPPSVADSDDCVTIDVTVTSSRGPVSGGVVEVVRGTESVGAGAVVAGGARVVATVPPEGSGPIPLSLRYVPAAPWWRPGAPVALSVRPARPGVAKQIVLAGLVAGIAAWVVGGWRRAPKPRIKPGKELVPVPPSGRAGVHIFGPSEGSTGWRGVVTDAHDGAPLPGARLRVVIPALVGDGVAARAVAGDAGTFVLETAHRSDARLIVEADTHSTYEVALPPPSVLAVALVTRRRALLDRLVRWARRYGAPFDAPPEPTPGHVRRAAGRAEAREIEAWAREVEHAAYGPEPVDEPAERKVRAVEPRGVG